MKRKRPARQIPALLLTGEYEERRIRVRIGRMNVLLPRVAFEALCRLVLGRLQKVPLIKLDKEQISRLRREINKQTGGRLGWSLIETGPKGHYTLRTPAAKISIDETFPALPKVALAEDLKLAIVHALWPSAANDEP